MAGSGNGGNGSGGSGRSVEDEAPPPLRVGSVLSVS